MIAQDLFLRFGRACPRCRSPFAIMVPMLYQAVGIESEQRMRGCFGWQGIRLLRVLHAVRRHLWDAPAAIAVVVLLLAIPACSIKQKAINSLASVLGEAEGVYLSDEDPELVEAAFPFNLKTIETLLQSSPKHRGLLLTATKAFLLYTYGFVEPESKALETKDYFRSREIRTRAYKLYLRAFRYGMRGLEVKHPGIGERLSRNPTEAAAELGLEDVPLAVWTAAALGSAIGVGADQAEATADIAVVGALLNRGLALDEDFDGGTIHTFLISYEAQRVGGSAEIAKRHYQRALELSGGNRIGLWLTWAETFSIPDQNREEFIRLLDQVLSFDIDSHPETRLLSILAQKRARWLRDNVDEFFLSPEGGS